MGKTNPHKARIAVAFEIEVIDVAVSIGQKIDFEQTALSIMKKRGYMAEISRYASRLMLKHNICWKPGTPDIIYEKGGLPCFVEVKQNDDGVRFNQLVFLNSKEYESHVLVFNVRYSSPSNSQIRWSGGTKDFVLPIYERKR